MDMEEILFVVDTTEDLWISQIQKILETDFITIFFLMKIIIFLLQKNKRRLFY